MWLWWSLWVWPSNASLAASSSQLWIPLWRLLNETSVLHAIIHSVFNYNIVHTVFENHPKCRICGFQFWHFLSFFVLLKWTCLVTLVDRKLHDFKNSPKLTVLAFLIRFCPLKIVNVARFAHNVECDFLRFSTTVRPVRSVGDDARWRCKLWAWLLRWPRRLTSFKSFKTTKSRGRDFNSIFFKKPQKREMEYDQEYPDTVSRREVTKLKIDFRQAMKSFLKSMRSAKKLKKASKHREVNRCMTEFYKLVNLFGVVAARSRR